MKTKIIERICERLRQDKDVLKEQFSHNDNEIKTRYLVIDNLLPNELAHNIYSVFPATNQMRRIKSFREEKYTFKRLEETPNLLKDITFAIQSPEVVRLVEDITLISKQEPDISLYAGGLSSMVKGDFLNPHLDNSHDSHRKRYRTLNLLYYVTPDWKVEYGGNLELWDKNVKKCITIPSNFNRLVIMETNRSSWHSVSPVKHDGKRCCVSNYYFSDISPEGIEYFNVTSFSARPEQKFRRVRACVDNYLRNAIRYIKKGGFGKKDIYHGA